MVKEVYNKAEIEIIRFESYDIVTASPDTIPGGNSDKEESGLIKTN